MSIIITKPLKVYQSIGLDRSAWEPCCVCSVNHRDWGKYQYSFCPYCGRPLTDAAWEMLEKRLGGFKK